MTPVRIIVMAKAPAPGLAKTRLIPALGMAGAAELATRMLARTLAAAQAAACGPVELCASPPADDEAWRDTAIPRGIEISAQRPGDLGERMAQAVRAPLAQGERVVLIGTDCAEISAPLLADAAAALNDYDATIHPTADGGYALLGLCRFDPSLFSGISWSTDMVARQTLSRLDSLGWQCSVGRTLHDIDEPADLIHWIEDSA